MGVEINDVKSNLSLMALPRHADTMMTPAVVAMMAWMEDTTLRKRQTHKNIKRERSYKVTQQIRSLNTLWSGLK